MAKQRRQRGIKARGQRPGRRGWWTTAPAEIVAAAEERIRSGESAASVHKDLELQNYCSPRACRCWAHGVRLSMQAGKRGETPSDADVEAALLTELHRRLLAGTAYASYLSETRLLLQVLRRPKPQNGGAG